MSIIRAGGGAELLAVAQTPDAFGGRRPELDAEFPGAWLTLALAALLHVRGAALILLARVPPPWSCPA